MIGEAKVFDVIRYLLEHGERETCMAFSISEETLNRYKREGKKYYGDSISTLLKLTSKFSTEELNKLATDTSFVSDIPKKNKTLIEFTSNEVTFGVLSDTHIGSIWTEPSYILSAFNEMKKQNCSFLLHAGDLVEGMMNRPGDIYELSHIGYKAQKENAVDIFKQWEKPLYIISGNHDCSYNSKLGAGMSIVEDVCENIPEAHYLGINDGDLTINGIIIKLWHGGDGNAYSLCYRDQKLIESFSGGEKPQVLITGHIHKAHYFFYRNVHTIGAGSMQKQSSWMRSKKIQAHTGFWTVTMGTYGKEVQWISPRFYPFYH